LNQAQLWPVSIRAIEFGVDADETLLLEIATKFNKLRLIDDELIWVENVWHMNEV